MGFFDSPREREGRSRYGDYLKEIEGLRSSTGDIGNIDDLRKRYGLTSATTAFDPSRRNLSTQRARALGSASARLGTNVATPESFFAPIEGQYAGAFGELEGRAGEAELGQQRFGAQLLDAIMGRKDQFGLGKLQMKGQGLDKLIQSLSGASTFDDILALAGTAAKFVPGKG